MHINSQIRTYEARRLPPMLIFDVTNLCNLKCIHCPQPSIQASSDFVVSHLPISIFDKVIDEIGLVHESVMIRFVGDGEPMLHPSIIEMIEAACRLPNSIVNLTTNGTRLGVEARRRLLESGIHMIDVSLDALTRPTYEMIRKEGRFQTVIANVINLIEEKRHTSSRTKILVSLVRQFENQAEVEGFIAFWQPLVDFVSIRNLHSANGLVKTAESTAQNGASIKGRYPCPHPWKRLIIDFHGRVKFCPTDWGAGSVVGHIYNRSLEQIWLDLEEVRSQHKSCHFRSGSICEKCTDWASSPWNQGYERIVDKVVFGRRELEAE